ncbi:CBN-GNRR-5 protein [Caenorhabditis brenneri]|uniref:CBN-GNRR-5 protein n=1 Tax=Caenorhabditis brenneri TaxID=135651 RepID=G0MTJ6_CAEBE|nr:CBN-GNRR-5 protein [Caenorhabditis brenneri]
MSYSNENLTLQELEEANALKEAEEISEILRIKIEVCIYVIVFFIGGPLNLMALSKSLRAFSRTHKAKSQILLLRITLNLADLMTLFLYVPKQIIWLITYQWYGGEFLCRACAFFSTFSFYLNSFVIACIAIDRVFGAYNISSLNAHRKAYIRCRNLLGCGWILAFLLSLPQAVVFTTTSPYENIDFKQCATIFMIFLHEKRIEYQNPMTSDARREEIDAEAASMERWEKLYAINHFLFVFWIPCIVIVGSYIVVLLILQGHLKQDKTSTSSSFSSSCFNFRVKSSDLTLDDTQSTTTRSPTRSTYLLQHEESFALRSSSSYDFESHQSHPTRQGSIKSRASNGGGTKFGAMAVTTIHRAKQHAKRQAALIIVAYLCIWSPYNLFTVLNLFGMPIMEELRHFLSFLNAAICVNTVVNPIIYGVFALPTRK